MLNIGKERVPLCEGPSRRSFLQLGTTGMATLSLPTLFKLEALGAVKDSEAKIRNCITIFLVGSPGQLDTWDMKPDAPAEVRGKFKPVQTNVNGIQICEHFPMMSKMLSPVFLPKAAPHWWWQKASKFWV